MLFEKLLFATMTYSLTVWMHRCLQLREVGFRGCDLLCMAGVLDPYARTPIEAQFQSLHACYLTATLNYFGVIYCLFFFKFENKRQTFDSTEDYVHK